MRSHPFFHPLSRLIRWSVLPWCAGCALTAAAQDTEPDAALSHFLGLDTLSDQDNWTRHFRIGAMVGLNIHGNFNANGGVFGISGHNPGSGIYDDGYVRQDATGSAGGQTGYWGYDNASQYNAATGDLTFHSASAYSFNGQDAASSRDPFDAGFELAYGDTYWTWNKAKIGWEFGFGILPIHLASQGTMSVNVDQTAYVFNTGGIVLPNAPYQGGYGGTGEPTITNGYASTSSSTNSGTLNGTRTLDTILYTFRLGPTIYWDINDQFGLTAGFGPALGFATSTLSYHESISYLSSTAINNGSISSDSITYGGYVNAILTYHAPENADIYLGVQYMPMSGVNISGGGRSARLDLNGQVYISAGVNWPF